MKEQQIISNNPDETLRLAQEIGRRLRGDEVVELVSDLGGGKTTFVRGLALGLGSRDNVRSPSFTLSNEYRSKKHTLYHFDFYRLAEPGIMREELAEMLANPQAIVAVEWGEVVEDVLPSERLTVTFKAKGYEGRELILVYPKSLNYLIPETN